MLNPRNTLSLFALGLSGGPDVPHAAFVAKRNREGGSGMGKLIQSELSVLESQPVHEHELLEDVKKHYAVQITFRMQITADVDIQWDTILSGRKLYIQVADAQRPVGSKEGFLAMLEYAEEYLNVSHIIVCFAKNHPERNVLVRGFMFLGFTLQPPGLNKIVPHAAIDNYNHYMVYDVES